jgi:hypothetical protein
MAMAQTKHALDGRPGPMPDIHVNVGGDVVFVMTPVGPPRGALVIRCDGNGDVWVSIRADHEPTS